MTRRGATSAPGSAGCDVWIKQLSEEVLAPHQRTHLGGILSSRYSFRLGCRQQAGKSFVLSAAAFALAAGYAGVPDHDVKILSKDDRTAANLIREVARHVRAAEGYEPVVDPKLGSLHRIALRNGRFIESFPGKPGALQGFTGSVIVDEVSQVEAGLAGVLDQALFVASAKPYFKVALASNADYQGSEIDRFLHSPQQIGQRARFALQNTTIHDVYPDGLPDDVVAIRDALGGAGVAGWRRFALNEFLAKSDGVISAALLDAAANAPMVHAGAVVLCVDPGPVCHATGFIVAIVGSARAAVLDSGHILGNDEDTLAALVAIARGAGAMRVVVDSGAAGYHLYKGLRAELGGVVARGQPQEAQERQLRTLQRLLASRAIHLPASQRDLLDDLAAIGEDDGKMMVPERPADAPGRVIHCDAAMALLQLMDEPALVQVATTAAALGSVARRPGIVRAITHPGPRTSANMAHGHRR